MMPQEFLPSRRVGSRVYVWFAAAAVALAAIGGILYTALGFDPESQVENALAEFGTAVDTGDQTKMAELVCPSEAALLKESEGYDPTAEPDAFAPPLDREFTKITI